MKYSQAPSQDAALAGLRDTVIWAEPTTPGIFVAAVTDNSTLNENALLACLGKRESDRASAIHDPVEKRHFIFRRCFQRFFVSEILNWGGALSALTIEHQLDMAPQCLDAPSLRLSFSSSGPTALACASRQHSIGIDIEKQRVIENVVALANRFFTPHEAAGIAAMPIATQSIAFLEHWTAKEAGLKAIGKGIVSGLNSFVLKRQKNSYNIDFIDQIEAKAPWQLEYVSLLPDHIIAVIHSHVAVVHNLDK
jgi:phosphopantetheine--protein transferase-like protein